MTKALLIGGFLKLLELIDINTLQELQDSFADAVEMGCVIYDDKGPITKPSKFAEFCTKVGADNPEELKACEDCNVSWGKIAAQKGKPIIYKCHANLTNFAAPIIVNGEHIASILGGQVLTQEPTVDLFRELTAGLDLDEDKYLELFKKIKFITNENVTSAVNFLHLFANTLSKIAHQNILLIRHAERETLLKQITETIRSSLDINEVKNTIVTEICQSLKADRCFIIEYKQKFLPVKHESLKSLDVASCIGFDLSESAKELEQKNLANEDVVIADMDEYIKENNLFNTSTEKHFRDNGVQSGFSFPIVYSSELLGLLVIHYTQRKGNFINEDCQFVKTLAGQVATTLHQAKLFEEAKKKAENERTLRDIMLSSVQMFSIKDIIKTIINEAGKLFEADRCFFIEVDLETLSNLPIRDYAEYRSSEDIRSHQTRTPTKVETEVFIRQSKSQEVIFVEDLDKIDLPEQTRWMLKELSVKSYLIAFVFYADKLYGAIVWHYVRDFKYFSQDEIDMAKAIANQSAVVIHKAELFEITRIQSEREKISKNIIEILRSTLDKDLIKKLFVKNIGKFLNADRIVFSEYDDKKKQYKPVDEDSEYLANDNIKSFMGYDWNASASWEYIQPILEKREFHIFDLDEYIKHKTPSLELINFLKSIGIKSNYNFPVIYQHKIIGFFSISYVRDIHILTSEDINRIRNICTQAGIAMYHADLYKEAQKSVQAHAEFINKLSIELKDPLTLIVKFSEDLSTQHFEREEEMQYFTNINDNAKKLLYFIDDAIKEAGLMWESN